MSREPWSKVELSSSTLAQGLQTVKDGISPVIQTTETILKVIKAISNVVYNLYVDISDPSALALKAAIEAVEKIVKEAFKDTGLYVLPVPFRTIYDPSVDTIIRQLEMQRQPGDVADMMIVMNEALATGLKITTPEGNGGNAGFLATVTESLNDELDSNRPKFSGNDYVAGMVMVYGATVFGDIIKLVKHLSSLFRLKIGGLDPLVLPKPKNLTARMTVSPGGDVTKLCAIKIDWEAVPVSWTLRAYGDVSFDIRKVVIYRTTTPIKRNTPMSTLAQYKIAEFEYDGLTSLFYDESWTDDMLGTPVYYAVGYALTAVNPGGTDIEFPDPLEVTATSVQMPQQPVAGAQHGVPPDWQATTMFTLIPALKSIVEQIEYTLETWKDATKGGKDRIKEFLDFLNKEIQRYSNWALQVLGTIQEIVDMLTLPSATMGIYFFEGRGGNDLLLSTLAEALSDTADENRPAFDTGTELVGGFIGYVGSSVPTDAQRAIAILKTLFGSSGIIANAYKTASDSIDTILRSAEAEICFNKNLLQISCETPEETSPGFDDSMEPAEEDSLCNRTS